MSHISKIELEIKDLQCLKEACKQLGFHFCEGKKEYKWFGHWIGQQPLPTEVTEDMLGSCDHAIHIDGCKYEIGVVKKRQGIFTALGQLHERRFTKSYWKISWSSETSIHSCKNQKRSQIKRIQSHRKENKKYSPLNSRRLILSRKSQ